MRVMLTAVMDTQISNETIKSGRLPECPRSCGR